MALTGILEPNDYLPIYNDYMWVVNTTFTPPLPPNYRYVADIYINNDFITRTKVFPNPSNYGIFRLDRICQDYISYDYHPRPQINENVYPNPSSIANIYLNFFEEYGSLSTGTTIFSATSAQTQYRRFYNGALSYRGDLYQNYDPTTFNPNLQRGKKTFIGYEPTNYQTQLFSFNPLCGQFMTNGPRSLKMDYNDTYTVNIIQTFSGGVDEVIVETYDETNNQLGSYAFPNPYNVPSLTGSTSLMGNDLLTIGIGPLNINSVQYSFGSAPIIDQSVVYYKVYTRFNDGVSSPERTSEEYTIIMNHKKYYQKFRFAWLNAVGGFDRFSFEGRNSQTKEVINTTEFKTLYGDGTSTNYSYNSAEFSREIIYQSVQNTYTVNTQFITENEAYWLNELYTSPVVYLEVSEVIDEWNATEDVGGLLKLYFPKPHNLKDQDLVMIIDCDDPTNNQYSSVVVENDMNCLVATSYFPSSSGIIIPIGKTPPILPVILNDKTYTIKQAITPRNISVGMNFTLSLDDPKQRGGKDNDFVKFTP